MSTRTRFDPALVQVVAQHLQEFSAANATVQLAVLTSGDGFEVASYPPGRPATAKVAAMGSSMQSLSQALSVVNPLRFVTFEICARDGNASKDSNAPRSTTRSMPRHGFNDFDI